ncbi:hypothetical protein L3Y34_014865 [Caenorhabditis briggsae]|uniref:Uncharacterized protein n=1 Tax=Caenorhabditis briggsae TaxID=6238 RepID=A0AAE9IYD8_CAEBR|nr:hypothetical protein L3Y34_014865 [Caenorhabditis briggsae]
MKPEKEKSPEEIAEEKRRKLYDKVHRRYYRYNKRCSCLESRLNLGRYGYNQRVSMPINLEVEMIRENILTVLKQNDPLLYKLLIDGPKGAPINE